MLRSSDDDSDICFQGREAAYILCDEFFQIYKNFTKLRMLQATDAFPRARCIQDAVDKGVRGNVVPRPVPSRSASLALPGAGISGEPGSPEQRKFSGWRELGSPEQYRIIR